MARQASPPPAQDVRSMPPVGLFASAEERYNVFGAA